MRCHCIEITCCFKSEFQSLWLSECEEEETKANNAIAYVLFQANRKIQQSIRVIVDKRKKWPQISLQNLNFEVHFTYEKMLDKIWCLRVINRSGSFLFENDILQVQTGYEQDPQSMSEPARKKLQHGFYMSEMEKNPTVPLRVWKISRCAYPKFTISISNDFWPFHHKWLYKLWIIRLFFIHFWLISENLQVLIS